MLMFGYFYTIGLAQIDHIKQLQLYNFVTNKHRYISNQDWNKFTTIPPMQIEDTSNENVLKRNSHFSDDYSQHHRLVVQPEDFWKPSVNFGRLLNLSLEFN